MNDVFLPESFDELWRVFESHPEALVCAGGTDLLVRMRSGLVVRAPVACIDRIAALKGIEFEEDCVLRIGACTAHARIMSNPAVQRYFSVLARAVEGLGSPPIRNMGTIGGNICTASPAGDTLPPLYVLDAELQLLSRAGERRMRIRDFIVGPGQTLLLPGEIVAAVRVKVPDEYNVQHFEKVGQRNALACSISSIAALLQVADDGVVRKAAFAWGSVAPVVLTCPEAEEALIGNKLTADALRCAAFFARKAASPIGDVRAEADYRREVLGNLLLRLANPAWS